MGGRGLCCQAEALGHIAERGPYDVGKPRRFFSGCQPYRHGRGFLREYRRIFRDFEARVKELKLPAAPL
jgi:hypothetical protein